MYILIMLYTCRTPANAHAVCCNENRQRGYGGSGAPRSTKNNGQNDNRENDGEDEEQAAALVACCLLIPSGLPGLDVGLAGVVLHVLDVVGDGADTHVLLVDDLRHLPEQHVQVADALLDVANLLFPLDDKALLEVDLVLRGHLRQLLLLLQLLKRRALTTGMTRLCIVRGARSRDGRLFFLQSLALEALELLQGGLEVARDLCLFVLLLLL